MATTATTRRTSTKAKAAPVVEPDEDDFEDIDEDEVEDGDTDEDDLEELDEDDEPEAAPAPKAKSTKAKAATTGDKPKRTPPTRPAIEKGSPWLAAYVTENTDETYDARGIRMLLRKLAKDGKLARVVGEDRARYEFSGPEDPTVVAVMEMVTSGAAKALKQAGLQKVKDDAAARKAAKAKEAAEVAEDADEMEVEDVPTPAVRRRAAKAAAPAKATPAAPRRRAATAK
jgi:hypothetical protein